jgi:hypothetical protein
MPHAIDEFPALFKARKRSSIEVVFIVIRQRAAEASRLPAWEGRPE